MDRVDQSAAPPKSPERRGPSVRNARAARKMLVVTMVVLGVAALAQAVVYALLIVNRTILLHPVVAGAAVWLAGLASVAAVAAVTGCAVLLTRWLIARRAMAFRSFAQLHPPDWRPGWALWAGCLVPLVNLAWAPVYVLEVAAWEGRLPRLRKPIVVWWLLWALSTAMSILATATSRAHDAQGIANNTVAMMIAYLLGAAAVAAAVRVFEGFERYAAQRPAHRWVVVADDRRDAPEQPAENPPSAAVLVSDGREPAA